MKKPSKLLALLLVSGLALALSCGLATGAITTRAGKGSALTNAELDTNWQYSIQCVAAAGTVDAITADYSPDLDLHDTQIVAFRSSGANTSTTPTFAPDGGTARTITKKGNVALLAGDIGPAGSVHFLQYHSATPRWELLNPAKVNAAADMVGIQGSANGGTGNGFTKFSGPTTAERTFTLPDASSTVEVAGRHTIWVPAPQIANRATSGSADGGAELPTNKVMIPSKDFADGASVLYAQFTVRMPKKWNAGTVTASFTWTANSTSTNSVVWGVQGLSLGDDETIDAAFGAAQTVTDANTATAYQLHLSAETPAVTIAGAGKSEWVVFQVYRDPTSGSDTLAATANLLGVTIFFTSDAANDQ